MNRAHVAGLALLLALCACAAGSSSMRSAPQSAPAPAAAPARAPVAVPLVGENHAFALYNQQNRLIHSPIEHLERELRRRKAEGLPPITDVYVLSHGWNFTLEESARLWENYRISFEAELARLQKLDPSFQPFLIFIAWNSVSRPLASALESISPYATPGLLRGLVGLTDSIVFHIPSNWGETQQAFNMALGGEQRRNFEPQKFPGFDEESSPYREAVQTEQAKVAGADFQGYRVPVAVLLDELVRMKLGPDLPGAAPRFRIHTVGHSFGAKVISLSVFDATARLLLKADTAGEEQLPHCGSGGRDPEDPLAWTPGRCDAYIDSMVLLNPAMKIQELYNSVYKPKVSPASLATVSDVENWYKRYQGFEPYNDFQRIARAVPRKAIVYTRHDSATGWVFAMSQLVLDYEIIARNQDIATEFNLLPVRDDETRDPIGAVLRPLRDFYNYTAVVSTSFAETALRNAVIVVDRPVRATARVFTVERASEIPQRLLAIPFSPLESLRAMGNRGLKDAEDSTSLFTSWFGNRIAVSQLLHLESDTVVSRNREFLSGRIDCDDDHFRALSGGIQRDASFSDPHFFTFDAKTVYDGYESWLGSYVGNVANQAVPPGAHGDVRGYDVVDGMAKRDRTLMFLFNFTRAGRDTAAAGTRPAASDGGSAESPRSWCYAPLPPADADATALAR